MSAQEPSEVADQIIDALEAAMRSGNKAFIAVRCSSTAVVDRAREMLLRTPLSFGMRSLPVSQLEPPDLLGFLMHTSGQRGPAFLAYGLPRGLDHRIEDRFLEHINERTDAWLTRPSYLVLFVTMEEMRDLGGGARRFWNARDHLLAWPAPSDPGRYVPATIGGRMAQVQSGGVSQKAAAGLAASFAGGVSARGASGVAAPGASGVAQGFADGIAAPGGSSVVQSPDSTPWSGSPYARDDPEAPNYFVNSPPPAGRRWGLNLAPDDPAAAEALDAARVMLDDRQTEVARRQLAKAAKHFRQTGNPLATAECYVLLGRAAEDRVDHSIAYDWYKAALDVYEQIDDAAGFSDCANSIGYLRFLHGDVAGALDAFRRGIEYDEAAGDELRAASGQRRLGIIAEERGDLDGAQQAYDAARDIEQRNDDRRALSRSLNHLARVARRKGELDQAVELLEESLVLKEELEDDAGMASGFHELGNLRLSAKQLDEALGAYERALDIELAQRDVAGIAATQAQIGLVQKERFVFSDALWSLLVSKDLFRKLQSPNADVIAVKIEETLEMLDAYEVRSIEEQARAWVDELLAAGG